MVDADAAASHEQLALAGQLAVRSNEPAEVAAGLALRALAAARGALPAPTDLPWFHQCAITLLWAERYDDLQAMLDDAVAAARARGDASLFSGALAYRGWLAQRRGDLQAAEADVRTALDAANLPAPAMYRLRATAVLVEALTERGELDEAERVLAAVERAARRRLDDRRAAARQPRAAAARAVAAGGGARRSPARGRGGDRDGAREPELPAVALAGRPGPARAGGAGGGERAGRRGARARARVRRAARARRGAARRGRGDVRARRPSRCCARRSPCSSTPAPRSSSRGRARSWAPSCAASKRRVEAREYLAPALDAAHRLGAAPLAERAETEVRATGARPRRVLITGVASLTASESRVAELAADGLTNREIAQALFVTMRTVEGHLTQVFRKLDLSSREQLAGALAEEAP